MRIKELIKEKGYTQKEVAEKLGMSVPGLSQLLNGKPSYTTMEKIAEVLEVEVWELLVSREKILEEDHNTITCPVCRTRFRIDK